LCRLEPHLPNLLGTEGGMRLPDRVRIANGVPRNFIWRSLMKRYGILSLTRLALAISTGAQGTSGNQPPGARGSVVQSPRRVATSTDQCERVGHCLRVSLAAETGDVAEARLGAIGGLWFRVRFEFCRSFRQSWRLVAESRARHRYPGHAAHRR